MRSLLRSVGMLTAAWILAASAIGADEEAPRYRPLMLGAEARIDSADSRHFGVYIPTRFGGKLTVDVSSGRLSSLVGPGGEKCQSGQELGADSHGWYTFEVVGARAPYTVTTSFVQEGRSARRPWNFYYWPTKGDVIHEPWAEGNGRADTPRVYGDDVLLVAPGSAVEPGQDLVRPGPNGLLETPVAPGDDLTWFPNLYDNPSFHGADGTEYQSPCPLLKYDQLFRSTSRDWEASHSQNHEVSRWPGHCLGGAVASILLNEPAPSPGSGLTADELKALWAELGENHRNHQLGDYLTDIPAGPPVPGPDPCDRFAPRFHRLLETHLRARNQALLGNLRAFPPRGTPNEVWNHGIGRYTASYRALEDGDVRTVMLDVELESNSGSTLNGQDQNPRLNRYRYTVTYGLDGLIDESRIDVADWISAGGEALYAPLNLMEVVATRWVGHNPYVTEANVRAVDLANGGNPAYSPAVAGTTEPPATGLLPRIATRRGAFGSPTSRWGGLLRRGRR